MDDSNGKQLVLASAVLIVVLVGLMLRLRPQTSQPDFRAEGEGPPAESSVDRETPLAEEVERPYVSAELMPHTNAIYQSFFMDPRLRDLDFVPYEEPLPIYSESDAISRTIEHMSSAGFTITNVTARLMTAGQADSLRDGDLLDDHDLGADLQYSDGPTAQNLGLDESVWFVGFEAQDLQTGDIVPVFDSFAHSMLDETPMPEVSNSGYVLWDASGGTQKSGGLLEVNKPLSLSTLAALESRPLPVHTPTTIPGDE